MGFGHDALARQPLPTVAPETGQETPRLELVEARRIRRNRPVAILKIPRLWPATQVGRASSTASGPKGAGDAGEGLDAFGSEAAASAMPPTFDSPASEGAHSLPVWAPAAGKWLVVIIVSAGLAVAGVFAYQRRAPRTAPTGTVTLETAPPGLQVVIAGKSIGKTPLTTQLAPGSYDVQIGSAPNARTIKVGVAAGSSTVQRVEFADGALPGTAPTGGLRVQTEPSHLPVTIDGAARGTSPVAVDSLQPGEHEVSVRTATGIVRRTVTIQPRETVSLIVSSAAPAPDPAVVPAGWMSVSSTVPLQLREGGKVIGTSESDRLMLAAGDHDIEFANEALGFTARRTVKVAAGKTVATKIDLPNGVLSINAQPWAEVWVDGERLGETPIGNLARRVGTHEVVFRHPELGERRETVVIMVGKPARIGVDLRKK